MALIVFREATLKFHMKKGQENREQMLNWARRFNDEPDNNEQTVRDTKA